MVQRYLHSDERSSWICRCSVHVQLINLKKGSLICRSGSAVFIFLCHVSSLLMFPKASVKLFQSENILVSSGPSPSAVQAGERPGPALLAQSLSALQLLRNI